MSEHSFNKLANQEGKTDDKLSRPDQLRANGLLLVRPHHRGYYIPVKQLCGQIASNTLKQLKALMCDPNCGIICIHGVKEIGKTILMKHLHNRVLKWVCKFDHLFWVTCPVTFSVRDVQDAVASAARYDLSDISDLTVRAQELSSVLAGLGRYALFFDGVPDFFVLEEVGIPSPGKGNGCKVVVAATSLDCVNEMVGGCVRTIQLEQLPESEALELFLKEAGIVAATGSSVHSLDVIARLIVKECCGLPSKIVEVANSLYGIGDIREWRNTLFELQNSD